MFKTRYQNNEYVFNDDHVLVDGVQLQYSEMVDITHRASDPPAFVFTYGDRRITMPYEKADAKQILEYFKLANTMEPVLPVEEGEIHEVSLDPGQPAEPAQPAEAEPEYTEPAQPAEPEYVEPEPEYVEPAQPAEPEYVEPEPVYTEPVPEYVEPAPEYVEPAQEYIEPAQPAEPEYVEPAQPAEPEYVEPAQPAEPEFVEPTSEFVEPTQPAEPEYVEPAPSVEQSAVDLDQPVEQSAVDLEQLVGQIEEAVQSGATQPEQAATKVSAANKFGNLIARIKLMQTKKLIIIAAIIVAVILAIILLLGGMGKSVDGLDSRVKLKTMTMENGQEYKIAEISSDAAVPDYALNYYNTCFEEGDKIHWLINKKTNQTILFSDADGAVLIDSFESIEGEKDDPKLLGTGQIIGTWFMYPETGEIIDLR